MSKPTIKKASQLFSLSDQIRAAEDIVQIRLDKYGDTIQINIETDNISINGNIRRKISESAIHELATSIQQNGLLYPILVTQTPHKKTPYTLLVGEHRLRAYKHLGFSKIPAIVKEDLDSQSDKVIIQLIENMVRHALTPIEIADAMMTIRSNEKCTLPELALKLNKSLDTCKKYSRIHSMSDKEKDDHSQNKSSFNQILRYLDQRSKPKAVSFEQPSLFNQSDTKIQLKRLDINLIQESTSSIQEKIEACEQFIEAAKTQLEKKKL